MQLAAVALLALSSAACVAVPPPPNGGPMPPQGQAAHGPRGPGAGSHKLPGGDPCKPGFQFKGGMCVGPHVAVDPDGPDPYRQQAKCQPGTTRQIKVSQPDGGYRMVDQTCREHLRADTSDSFYMM